MTCEMTVWKAIKIFSHNFNSKLIYHRLIIYITSECLNLQTQPIFDYELSSVRFNTNHSKLFTNNEIYSGMSRTKYNAPEHDDITYLMLSKLPDICIEKHYNGILKGIHLIPDDSKLHHVRLG